MKKVAFLLLLFVTQAYGQKVDSLYVHLYTDSLKKGTYNYINIDGRLANGKYVPLDSSQVIFHTSCGKFFGNSLWLEPDCKQEKVIIRATSKNDQAVMREFVVYIKKVEDGPLRTEQQVKDNMRPNRKKQ